MLIKVGNFDCTEVWDGVFYKKLSNYPQVTDWEIRTIIEFIEYENQYGRECKIECEDHDLLELINGKIKEKETYRNTLRPRLLTECTACPYRKGCVTEYVCHTTSMDHAIKIFQCGKLLSALGRFPDEKDLSVGFKPGVRFYFKYEELIRHPKATFDGAACESQG